MKKIDYNPNSLSHHNENIQYWVTQGIVIDGERYSVEELFVRGDTLYGIISTNKIDFYEYPLATNVTQGTFDPSGILNRLDRLESIPQYKYDDTGINQRLDSIREDFDDNKTKTDQRVTLLENKPDKDNQELSISGNNLSISGGNTVKIPQPDLRVLNNFATKEYVDTLVKSSTYNPEPILDRIKILEAKSDKDTVYDDTSLKQRIKALEDESDNDTITKIVSTSDGVNISSTVNDNIVTYDVNINKALDNYYTKDMTYTKNEVIEVVKNQEQKATDITVYRSTFADRSIVKEGAPDTDSSPRITLTYSSSTGVGILKLDFMIMDEVYHGFVISALPNNAPVPAELIESQVWINNANTYIWIDKGSRLIKMYNISNSSIFRKRIVLSIPGIFKMT